MYGYLIPINQYFVTNFLSEKIRSVEFAEAPPTPPLQQNV